MNLVQKFAALVINCGNNFKPIDQIYLTNQIYHLVGEDNVPENSPSDSLLENVKQLIEVGIRNGKIGGTNEERDQLEDELTDLFTPTPSAVNQRFWNLFQINPKRALDYFYQLNLNNNYIKVDRIKKNEAFTFSSPYGMLEITINLSKPEKDPKEIAKTETAKQDAYPKCALCLENEGHFHTSNAPARNNHRIIRLLVGGKKWGFQYSPYAYFEQHCIFLDTIHEPMKIDAQAFSNLLEIVEMFPDYFVGSNADLPIVGGSILSHEHFQGGKHVFPMMEATTRFMFKLEPFSDVKFAVLNWPMTTIRLQGENRQELTDAANHILTKWNHYSDSSVDVVASSHGVPHHTVTPIARKLEDGSFELFIVLRDNQTSERFPDGIFHPHPEYQHIKKENIGLIEVMGRAILPPRLKDELVEVRKYLLNKPNDIKAYHVKWADYIKQTNNVTPTNADEIIHLEVGKVFMHVLENAGVFKLDDQGTVALKRFIKTLSA